MKFKGTPAVFRNGRYELLLAVQAERIRQLEMHVMRLAQAMHHFNIAVGCHDASLNELDATVQMVVDPEKRIPAFREFPREFGKGRRKDD
jgi:lactam utilization protein B